MSRLFSVCLVRTSDNAIKFFDTHDPILAKAGGHVTININMTTPAAPGVEPVLQQTVALRLCKRCGVAYVESEQIIYDKPSDTSIASPQGGNA